MNKILIGSTIVTLILLVLLLVTDIEGEAAVNQWLNEGYGHFQKGDYEAALTTYEAGLTDYPDNIDLMTNAGITSMAIGDYASSISYLSQVEGQKMALGNAYYYSAQGDQDQDHQKELLVEALESYKTGMINDPQNPEVKFNYEWVLRMLEEEEEEQEQEQEERGEEEEGEEGEEGGEGGEGEEGEEGEEEEGEEGEGEQEREGEGEEGEESEVGEEIDGEDELGGFGDEVVDSGDAALQQILRLLEAQEEESLKNNQGLEVTGGGDGNDW